MFINHACSFLDLGGITIEDNAQIGPRVDPAPDRPDPGLFRDQGVRTWMDP